MKCIALIVLLIPQLVAQNELPKDTLKHYDKSIGQSLVPPVCGFILTAFSYRVGAGIGNKVAHGQYETKRYTSAALLGGSAAYVITSSTVVWGVAKLNDGRGTFLGTFLGSCAGTLLAVPLIARSQSASDARGDCDNSDDDNFLCSLSSKELFRFYAGILAVAGPITGYILSAKKHSEEDNQAMFRVRNKSFYVDLQPSFAVVDNRMIPVISFQYVGY